MAVASAGGHWVQLRRLCKAWERLDVVYVSTEKGLADLVRRDASEKHFNQTSFTAVVDANLSEKLRLAVQALQIFLIILRHRPDVVITTGAAPGYFAIRIGKILGARTIWIDSMANAEELSTSGKRIAPYADLWLTQWEHLSKPQGPSFLGSVL